MNAAQRALKRAAAQKQAQAAAKNGTAKEYRLPITKQQERIYRQALEAFQVAQDRVNTVASTLLASRGVEDAQNVRLDLSDRRRPALLYVLLPEDEKAKPTLVKDPPAVAPEG